MIDTERIFMYRAFRIARGDTTPLANFDQTLYIESSRAHLKDFGQLLDEYRNGRNASLSLLQSLERNDLHALGTASNRHISARAAASIVPGHDIWHMDIIKERYL